jgi:hypothetical protein
LLVPPVRLGRILNGARVEAGESIDGLVARCGYAYDSDFFELVEAGEAPLDEPTVRWLAALYDMRVEHLVPQRARLVIDLNEGSVAMGPRFEQLIDVHPDDVLAKYLALVMELRAITPGAPMKIRDLDLDVLATALTIKPRDVQRRLHTLMRGDREPLNGARRRLRSRLVVPMAGILVACTAVGALLFERAGDSSEPASSGPSSSEPATGVAADQPANAPTEVQIGDAAVLVRRANN